MWSVEVLGERFSENELTIGQYVKLEDELGVTWRAIHPLTSAKAAATIVALLYAERKNLAVEHARSLVDRASAYEFVDSIEMNAEEADAEDDTVKDPPKAA